MGRPRKRLLVSRDAIMMAPRQKIAPACANIFDSIQHLQEELQLLALAASFSLLTDTTGTNPADVYQMARNIITAPGMEKQFDAMRFHLEDHLLNDGRV